MAIRALNTLAANVAANVSSVLGSFSTSPRTHRRALCLIRYPSSLVLYFQTHVSGRMDVVGDGDDLCGAVLQKVVEFLGGCLEPLLAVGVGEHCLIVLRTCDAPVAK